MKYQSGFILNRIRLKIMKIRYTSVILTILLIIFISSCDGSQNAFDDITFGMSFKQVNERIQQHGVLLQKCDQWYPRIDTYFCFIDKYYFSHVTVFLEFYENRFYLIRYQLNDNKDPSGSYTFILNKIKNQFGNPEATEMIIPPPFLKDNWNDHHKEIMKKGGYVYNRWSIPNNGALKLKLFAGSYYFEITWEHYDNKLSDEAEKFRRSIIMNP
jgi:hypothetical protein